MLVRTLSALECTKLLETNRLGHLSCTSDSRPYVVPIYYAYHHQKLYSFSMPGRKLDMMRANPRAALLVEEFLEGQKWRSVIAEGRFEALPDRTGFKIEREHAWALLSKHANWWEPGSLKPIEAPTMNANEHLFYRINIEEMSGRETVVEVLRNQ
jgi:uncharacterized protein